MKISSSSKPSVDIRKTMLIQQDFPKKNKNQLKFIEHGLFFIPFHMFHRQYTRIYLDMNKWASFSKNKSLNKNNYVFYIHVNEDKLYALRLFHWNWQMQHPGVFPLISNALLTLAGEITLSCSRKFLSKSN